MGLDTCSMALVHAGIMILSVFDLLLLPSNIDSMLLKQIYKKYDLGHLSVMNKRPPNLLLHWGAASPPRPLLFERRGA